jgi:hypothetical protein
MALMLIGIPGSIFAANNDSNPPIVPTEIARITYMPEDILAALDTIDTDANKTAPDAVTDELLSAIELPRSMSISIPKIDIMKIHDTHPLVGEQIKNLKNHGYSDSEIRNLDVEAYNQIEKTWKLPSSMIPDIITLYPELKGTDISTWTIGDFLAYSYAADARSNVYAPTQEQANALAARNITLNDAVTLLKDFYTYDCVLSQSDETLRQCLEGYYQFTIDNIKGLAEISKQRKAKSIESLNKSGFTIQAADPLPGDQNTIYFKVLFPGGYNGNVADWFHIDSHSMDSAAIRTSQAAAVVKGYNRLYQLSGSTYMCGNLWGTWSQSQNGAHEGIDYNYGTNPKIYTMATGSVYYYYNNGTSRSQVCVTDGSYTYTYLHMDTINIKNNGVVYGPTYPSGVNVTAGSSTLGTQGKVGNAYGEHVHFEVHSGSTISLFYESDNTLSCLNPYDAINRF